MYPYHNRIKQRINNGELIDWEFAIHDTIGKCLMLYFNTPPYTRPIRPSAYWKYEDIINKKLDKKQGNDK